MCVVCCGCVLRAFVCACVCVCVRSHVVHTGHVFRSSRVGTTVANRGWNDEALQSRRTLSAIGTAGLHSRPRGALFALSNIGVFRMSL